MLIKIFSALFSLAIFFCVPNTQAATCCGGGSAIPSLIMGDDQYQWNTSFSYSHASDDVSATNHWKRRVDKNDSQSLTLSGASLLSDRWQIGINLPLMRRSVNTNTGSNAASGLGDISASLTFEALPEWEYSVWKPKGFVFLQVTAPTGNSIYDSTEANALDSRGRGLWIFSLGSIFSKNFSDFDTSLSLEGHHSLSREMQDVGGTTQIHPGYGASATASFGWNYRAYRAGISMNQACEGSIQTTGANSNDSNYQRVTTASVAVSYLWRDVWSSSINYSDQSLFGSPHNTSLNKSIALNLQRRWPR